MKLLDKLINLFNQYGYEAYGVGGCVRDYLLNRPISDYDIATSATPIQMLEIFKEYKTSTIGQKYGTIGIYFENTWFECTTYRIDSDSNDKRHPESVEFSSSLKQDVLRRDFTINALAYKNNQIIDYVDGQKDLENKLIRTVGHPQMRFKEDALRMLRAFRFSAQLGFEIESETLSAINTNEKLLNYLSKERITQELLKFVMGEYVNETIQKYRDSIEPLLSTKLDVITNQKLLISRFRKAFPAIDLELLSLSNSHRNKIKLIDETSECTNPYLVAIHKQIEDVVVMSDYYNLDFDKEKVLTIQDLAIDGYDLINLKIPEYKRSDVLYQLAKEVVLAQLPNTKEDLLSRVEDIYHF